MEPWILTHTGRKVWLERPRPQDIDPLDIAQALGNLCRYTGHAWRFYSVAEHSMRVADAVADKHRPWALLHDAHEAYLGDISAPLKLLVQEPMRTLEANFDRAIWARFGLAEPSAETRKAIKDMDWQACLWERKFLLPEHPDWRITEPRGDFPGAGPQYLWPVAVTRRYLRRIMDILEASSMRSNPQLELPFFAASRSDA